MEWLADPETWIALGTLTLLEVVLGIDNVIFISILVQRLPREQQAWTRRVGLMLAMGLRVVLLFGISWVVHLTQPLFTVVGQEISGRDLILIIGGLFLLAKATHEIHKNLEGEVGEKGSAAAASVAAVLVQVALLDVVFSLDSVLTAVGMSDQLWVMITAVVLAVGFMMLFAGPTSRFVERHPTVKILALSFLLLIGVTLVTEGFDHHIPKGYLYFAMAFSMFIEMLNFRLRKNARVPVQLHGPASRVAAEGVTS